MACTAPVLYPNEKTICLVENATIVSGSKRKEHPGMFLLCEPEGQTIKSRSDQTFADGIQSQRLRIKKKVF